MTLDAQGVSLELAQQLQAAGVPQESLFWWEGIWCDDHFHWGLTNHLAPRLHDNDERYAAFTVAELGELLPDHSYSKRIGKSEWIAFLPQDGPSLFDKWHVSGTTEADARAQMLLYLIEQKLVTFPEARRA